MAIFKKNNYTQKEKRKIKNISLIQRLITTLMTLLVVFFVIAYGSAPKQYMFVLGEQSQHDISAPREIENTILTERNAKNEAQEIELVVTSIKKADSDMLNTAHDFFDNINLASNIYSETISNRIDELTKLVKEEKKGINSNNTIIVTLEDIQKEEKLVLLDKSLKKIQLSNLDIINTINQNDLLYLVSLDNNEFSQFKSYFTKDLLLDVLDNIINESNIKEVRDNANKKIEQSNIDENLKQIAEILINNILKPNSEIDYLASNREKELFIEKYKTDNPVLIGYNDRIISKGDIVTEDIMKVLRDLYLLDTEGSFNYLHYISVFSIVLFLFLISAMYLRKFNSKVFCTSKNVLLICVIVSIVSIMSLGINRFLPQYVHILIPIFISYVLIAVFIDLNVSIVINILYAIALSLLTENKLELILLSAIAGTIVAFIAANANQRRKISLAGVITGLISIVIVVVIGLFKQNSWRSMLTEGGIVFINGFTSVVLAIGFMPFIESTFNIITPLKLLELADPNHTLIKRLLMEAPGTYHHSLMVSNLAEVATRAIGGNSLLARVGAYYHDVGKLQRPQFFKENQMNENPHDRMTPNLSTLVITSHTSDGSELAEKYKIPVAIRDIIMQHHGTTLVAYFFHKAQQGEKGEEVKAENFRYIGPKPNTKEAAVVLLADSVEAAVRSMVDKTKGRIEGLIRKIIKDKLDDGQLDHCELTLKDLSIIADSFLTVLSGVFHERTEYPEIIKKDELKKLDNKEYNINIENK